jgi:hypothetical protein
MLEYNIKITYSFAALACTVDRPRWPTQWIGLVGQHKQWAALVAALAEPLNNYNVKL